MRVTVAKSGLLKREHELTKDGKPYRAAFVTQQRQGSLAAMVIAGEGATRTPLQSFTSSVSKGDDATECQKM